MSESTSMDLGEQIAHALAERRPQPSSDFEARLERASEPASSARMTGLLAIAAAACAVLVVLVTRPENARESASIEQPEGQPPPSTPPPPTLPHDGNYSANQYGSCHRQTPASLPAAHETKGSFPLLGRHRDVACATCHVPNKPAQRECSSCHKPGTWKLKP